MANLRAIRMRIKSVESTRQITKSMKMVAAAKLRKTQAASQRLRAFADRSGQILPAPVSHIAKRRQEPPRVRKARGGFVMPGGCFAFYNAFLPCRVKMVTGFWAVIRW